MKLEFDSKELNYIEGALRSQIIDYATGPLAGMGNVPHLLRFTKKLYRKIRVARGWPANARIRYIPKHLARR